MRSAHSTDSPAPNAVSKGIETWRMTYRSIIGILKMLLSAARRPLLLPV
jgi:hypothetical protein